MSKRTEAHKPSIEDLIPVSKAADVCGLSPNHLRLLVSTGKVWGIKPGREWLTTMAAVNGYLATERKPGPKPQDHPPQS